MQIAFCCIALNYIYNLCLKILTFVISKLLERISLRVNANKMVEIRTPTENIQPSSSEKLLGCWVDEHLKWSELIRDNDEHLIKALNIRPTFFLKDPRIPLSDLGNRKGLNK